MTTTAQTAAVKAGSYTLAAESWDQYVSKGGRPEETLHHRRGDTVKLDAADAARLWRAGALVNVGDPLPSLTVQPSPTQVLYTEALERQAADAEAARQQKRAAQASHARYVADRTEGETR